MIKNIQPQRTQRAERRSKAAPFRDSASLRTLREINKENPY